MNRAETILSAAKKAGDERGPGWELGVLSGEIKSLCAELEAYEADIRKDMCRHSTMIDGRVPVVCGYRWATYEPHIGSGCVDLEVWLNGCVVTDILDGEVLARLEAEINTYHAEVR